MTEMTEGLSQLEQKRFVINPEALQSIKTIRRNFEGLTPDYPWLCGVGFFGSMTKGKTGRDVDFCVFYNSDKMTDTLSRRHEWNNIIQRLHNNVIPPFDTRLLIQSDGLRVDISYGRTISDIAMFEAAITEFLKDSEDEEALLDGLVIIPPTQNLFSQFFLVVGEEVYKNRKFILDCFKNEKRGLLYLRLLMKSLARFERFNKVSLSPNPPYEKLPKSFEEAEAYFTL